MARTAQLPNVNEPQRVPPKLLTPEEVAEQVALTITQLSQLRYLGRGPLYLKLGRRVRYRQSDVDDWLAASTRQSTQD